MTERALGNAPPNPGAAIDAFLEFLARAFGGGPETDFLLKFAAAFFAAALAFLRLRKLFTGFVADKSSWHEHVSMYALSTQDIVATSKMKDGHNLVAKIKISSTFREDIFNINLLAIEMVWLWHKIMHGVEKHTSFSKIFIMFSGGLILFPIVIFWPMDNTKEMLKWIVFAWPFLWPGIIAIYFHVLTSRWDRLRIGFAAGVNARHWPHILDL